ncbi:MAG: hypothetical protein KKG47_13920 [Proteobacteria bacterium]|nr:hypothetical protein [Pseudomonadota bacterium]MBU1739106.1 hypothetical protein [Pseudomonadota bacterium]
MLILKVHPMVEFAAILLAFYAAWLGFQRTRTLHFGKTVPFRRDLHVIIGAASLVSMLSGIAAAEIIVSRFEDKGIQILVGMHGNMAMALIPFLLFALFSGFYLYLNPAKRIVLPALHAINNLIVLLLCLYQIFSGVGIVRSLPGG